MRVLIIKLSSMGDVVHAMPAISDLSNHVADVTIDWLVDGSFKDLALLHSKVNRVFTVNLRSLKNKLTIANIKQIINTIKLLRTRHYDYIIDCQGLWKSSIITALVPGVGCGFSWSAARDKFASLLYNKKVNIAKNQHAIIRLRQLVARTFQYNISDFNIVDNGIKNNILSNNPYIGYKYCVFVTHTTWHTKEWPVEYWQELARKIAAKNIKILLPWGNEQEYVKSKKIASDILGCIVLPKTSFCYLTAILYGAQFAITVDTGIAHLAAAINIPVIGLYGATSITKSGFLSGNSKQQCLSKLLNCAPCLKRNCKYVDEKKEPVPCMQQLTPSFVLRQLYNFSVW